MPAFKPHVALAAALIGAGTLATAASAAPVAKIYVSLPRHGDSAVKAKLVDQGVRAALEAHHGEAGGRRIVLVQLDGARRGLNDPRQAAANARAAVADPRAIAYVGEGGSGGTLGSVPITAAAGLVQLAPVSSADQLTTRAARGGVEQPTLVRPIPSDSLQAKALVGWMRKEHVRRLAVLDDGDVYGRDLRANVVAAAEAAGLRVVARGRTAADGRAATRVVKRVAQSRAQAVVLAATNVEGSAATVRALHRLAPRIAVYGGDSLAHDSFAQGVGRSGGAVHLTQASVHPYAKDRRLRLVGARPDAYTVLAYDGMTAVLDAIDRAARTDAGVTRQTVRDAIFDGRLQKGLGGPWKIGADGNPTTGVFDELHVVGGQVLTPVEHASRRMVRKLAHAAQAQMPMASAPWPAITIGAGDLEATLMQVQSQRAGVIDDELKEQMLAIQQRHADLQRINDALSALSQLRSLFAAGAPGTQTLDSVNPSSDVIARVTAAASIAAARDALAPLTSTASTAWSKAQLEAAITAVKQAIDASSNQDQLDMLRLQGLSDKRNEALDLLAQVSRKLSENKDTIIGNVR
jgi:ABC-type branched-subunit amino acid transport system substrate-binding protein